MLKFDDIYNTLEFNIGKKRLKSLEKVLRIMGNFTSKEDIIVKDDDYHFNMYQVIDNDNTIFKFNHYSISEGNKNFQLVMKKKNSKVEYIYNFFNYAYKKCNNEIKLMKMICRLNEDRSLSMKFLHNNCINLEIQEKDKNYILGLRELDMNQYSSEFKKLVNLVNRLEEINLRNLLNDILFQIKLEVGYFKIYYQNQKIAEFVFKNKKLNGYQIITEDGKEITVTMDDSIIRKIKNVSVVHNAIMTNISQEDITQNCEIIHKDIKKLIKKY